MVGINPMTAIAAYKSAAMSMVNQQGVTDAAQSQMRTFNQDSPVNGISTKPHGIDGNIPPIGPQGPMAAGTPPELSFSTLLKQGIENTVAANRHAEYMSMEGIAGRADVTEVVTAIANAEASLNTMVAIRDRVISAYQEIMRMPV